MFIKAPIAPIKLQYEARPIAPMLRVQCLTFVNHTSSSSVTSNLLKSDQLLTTNYAPFALDREPGCCTLFIKAPIAPIGLPYRHPETHTEAPDLTFATRTGPKAL